MAAISQGRKGATMVYTPGSSKADGRRLMIILMRSILDLHYYYYNQPINPARPLSSIDRRHTVASSIYCQSPACRDLIDLLSIACLSRPHRSTFNRLLVATSSIDPPPTVASSIYFQSPPCRFIDLLSIACRGLIERSRLPTVVSAFPIYQPPVVPSIDSSLSPHRSPAHCRAIAPVCAVCSAFCLRDTISPRFYFILHGSPLWRHC